ncbi:MAG TPA: HRDC domain-containing protein [Pirellulaceae bacterium]|nr:HRDC domain-containing protein [Pirellulaceae bacterium]HMO93156.1 HRDC domain-containing protein [Pirellulaceae bacterium]HMP70015.1 HRDC domain-containing protein [Pirellulaceae bacterium]
MTVVLNKPDQFHKYCDTLESCSLIGIDTEFVGEDHYRPKLCLIQVAAEQGNKIIDAIELKDISRFWHVITMPGKEIILHAGQQELHFCLNSVNVRPQKVFDVQIGAGLLGWDYPASYANLVSKLLDVKLKKSQSRTDWRKRPLNAGQLKYAAEDVAYLLKMHEAMKPKLTKIGRIGWMDEEIHRLETRIRNNESNDRWRQMAGLSVLSEPQLAIACQLWIWREKKAAELDRPVRRLLRDDLIIELAKLGSEAHSKIFTIREMTQQRFRRHIDDISLAISEAKKLKTHQLPEKVRKQINPHYGLAGQMLNVVLSALCEQKKIAAGLVGSLQDVHDLIAWHESKHKTKPPKLAEGWRCELIGSVLRKALQSQVKIAIGKSKGGFVPKIEIEDD